MAGERMVPILPCPSIDEVRDFYVAAGFEVTHWQRKPNPYLALCRDGVELHYAGIEGFRPDDSYASCIVLVPDIEAMFEVFAAGLRTRYGRLPVSGFPRITRPRRRANAGNVSGFSFIDHGGNWIRVFHDRTVTRDVEEDDPSGSRLGRTLANAIVLADSKGDVDQAAKILAGALSRAGADADEAERTEAQSFLDELLTRLSAEL